MPCRPSPLKSQPTGRHGEAGRRRPWLLSFRVHPPHPCHAPPEPNPQGGSEKLGDEDLEAVLDKLVKMLAYISGEVLQYHGTGIGCWCPWDGWQSMPR